MSRHSTCALDCPDACAMLVDVDDAGRATRLRGDPDHPVTQGFLCAKVTRYLDRVYHPDRLLYPQKRVGAKGEGRFARISWDEALDTIAERLSATAAEYGPEAVLPYSYAGTMGYLQNASMDRRFFHRMGASRLERTVCSSTGGAALRRTLGESYGTEPEQFRDSKLILIWGSNTMATNVHLWPFLVEARRNGARMYVIDPVRNKTASLADRHFAIHPGSDQALALGLIHVILRDGLEDRDYIARHTNGMADLSATARAYTPAHTASLTGIAADDIEALAREYATTKPAAIKLGYGPQRSERGGAAISTVCALPALTGSWRQRGGGLQMTTSGAFKLDRPALEMPELQARSPLGREARMINMVRLGRALKGEEECPPVKALFVYNSNPAAIAPDQINVLAGLRRTDLFTVVAEQMPTDTAAYADIVLPATTFLEHTDIYFAYGHYYLQLARPAVDAPGECRPNTDLFRALAQRMGYTEPCFADDDDRLIDQALGSGHRFLDGITRAELEARHSIRLNVGTPGEPFLPFAEGGFGTADGKCDLRTAAEPYTPPVESRFGDAGLRARYPLELLSPKNHHSLNSTFGYRDATDTETGMVHIHRVDAASRAIENEDLVRVYNDRGSVVMRASVEAVAGESTVAPGVISAPAVRWPGRAADGRNVNALVSDRLTDIGNGPVFYSCLVQLEKCGD
ncbi:MAG: molybdopterin-dependent oxidoreductase [Bryobacteraceae bacterium]